jgi:prepilin-type N-terminal cleavage/methylation domain-containing protein
MDNTRMLGIRKNHRGDTIIEVMIALAVLGSVLVGGYSIATRSINSVRVSQERGEALKIAEGQLEQLRARLNGVPSLNDTTPQFNSVFIRRNNFFANNGEFKPQSPDPATGFCFNVLTNTSPVQTFNHSPANVASYAPECTSSRYRIAIVPRYTADYAKGTLTMSYTVTIRWDRAGGGEPQTLSLTFRTTVDGVNEV